jgi:hypothetical protein
MGGEIPPKNMTILEIIKKVKNAKTRTPVFINTDSGFYRVTDVNAFKGLVVLDTEKIIATDNLRSSDNYRLFEFDFAEKSK